MADNVAITRDAIDAWNAHDREGYVAFYKPDVAPPRLPGRRRRRRHRRRLLRRPVGVGPRRAHRAR